MIRQPAGVVLTLLCLFACPVLADQHEDEAQQAVVGMACGSATVGAMLDQEARAHSRRDLGWRFFPDGDNLDVERSFRVSKSMEVRFRWKVDHSGHVMPVTESAKSLCKPP